ncbi:tRNA (cytidine(34)-2'-O)-methyltransferase [bacterium]|nr:tRNA (cytidine(34)-2'-O)-methyltransferase [bacterium]
MLRICLVEPEIPPNTGNVSRLSAALAVPLHLVEPLGFDVSEKAVKRAGLDYWEHVQLQVHPNFSAFVEAARPKRLIYTSSTAETLYTEVEYQPGDCLVFGKETAGLDPALWGEHPGLVVRIPHWGPVRSLNLSNAVAIVAYEAMRQLRERGDVPPPVPRAEDRPPTTPYERRKRRPT